MRTLDELMAALTDAAGLLDACVEDIGQHRREARGVSANVVELHAIEDTAARAWASAQEARTRLQGYAATITPLGHEQVMDLVSSEARRFDAEEGRGLLP